MLRTCLHNFILLFLASGILLAEEASLRVEHSHLIVPVSNRGANAERVSLGIFSKGEKLQNFFVNLPKNGEACWFAAYPLAPFGIKPGDEITVKPDGVKGNGKGLEKAFALIRSGRPEEVYKADDYDHPYRNQFHVSSRHGWNNDPNGMLYKDGVYHLYYQHNPFGIGWGNMHWGHWTSRDLLHWEEQPLALFQRTNRDKMFSGGGFIDFNNSAGLGKDVLFAAFTSTGRGECLAYSKDGGQTFAELEENPMVTHRGRDPKVIWYEPEKKWVMVVYDLSVCEETKAAPMEKGKKKFRHGNAAFYESHDLRKWKRTGAFTHPDRSAIHECPELFELTVEGKPDEKHWIYYAAANRFFIGNFDGKTFRADRGPLGAGRGAAWAAQTFSDVPDGRRIQIIWAKPAMQLKQHPCQISNQAMSLPHELSLKESKDGLWVYCWPVEEVKSLRVGVIAEGKNLMQEAAHTMLQQAKGELSEVLITFEKPGNKKLQINGMDCSFNGSSARMFIDRTFSEIYIDDGREYVIRVLKPDQLGNHETSLNDGGKVKSLMMYRLNSIWR